MKRTKKTSDENPFKHTKLTSWRGCCWVSCKILPLPTFVGACDTVRRDAMLTCTNQHVCSCFHAISFGCFIHLYYNVPITTSTMNLPYHLTALILTKDSPRSLYLQSFIDEMKNLTKENYR